MPQDEELQTGLAPELKTGGPEDKSTESTSEEVGEETEGQEESHDEGEEGGDEAAEGSEEGSEEVGEETAEAVSETPKKPKSRAQERITKLAAELKAERESRDKLIEERAIYAARLEQLQQQQERTQSETQRRQHEDRMSLLDPTERALYETQEQMRQMEHKLNQMEIMRKDDRDRAQFHAKAAHDPLYKKYADEIEQSYQDGLKRGVTAPREDLLAWRIGKAALEGRNTQAEVKKTKAAKKIDSVTSKPASAKSDVSASKSSGKSLEQRLDGVNI